MNYVGEKGKKRIKKGLYKAIRVINNQGPYSYWGDLLYWGLFE